MLKDDFDYPDKSRNTLTFKCIKEADIKKDLVRLAVKHFADDYGMDFTLRKSDRFYDLAMDHQNGLYYFAAYLGEKIVASCNVYYSDGVLGFDDLITDIDHRHQGIATALMKCVHNRFQCPMFLHADMEDTPKEMYAKLGFDIVKKEYEYFISE